MAAAAAAPAAAAAGASTIGAAATSGSAMRRRGTAISATGAASMPVATTETRIAPSISVSRVEPTMMLASGSTFSRIRLAASSSSNSVRS